MADTLSFISIAAFLASAICFVVTVILFIRFKIPSVIGDLSGKNARKSIEQMREANNKSGKKSYKPSKVNLERGKLTETMHGERPAKVGIEDADSIRPETGLIHENQKKTADSAEIYLLYQEEKTELLMDENETVALDESKKGVHENSEGIPIEILEEIIFVHTNELIQ